MDRPPADSVNLDVVNDCFRAFDVVVYLSESGKYRLSGDVNRMQQVVDGPCGPLITKQMLYDFRDFFAEVDIKIVEYINSGGGLAIGDPELGIDPGDTDPELVERSFLRAYEFYRIPRPELG